MKTKTKKLTDQEIDYLFEKTSILDFEPKSFKQRIKQLYFNIFAKPILLLFI